ncbi:MAG: phage minor head protein [Ginsengibacter sp.]
MVRSGAMGVNKDFIDLKIRYFDSGILKDCKGIDDYSRNKIIEILKTGIQEGRSLNWIVEKQIKETEGLSSERARLIARTENLTASNYASYVQATKTGLLMKKRWLSAKDGRVRNSHRKIDGICIDMEDYFIVGNSKILIPGARIQQNGLPTPAKEIVNCRCVVLYEPQRINGRLVEHDYGVLGI